MNLLITKRYGEPVTCSTCCLQYGTSVCGIVLIYLVLYKRKCFFFFVNFFKSNFVRNILRIGSNRNLHRASVS